MDPETNPTVAADSVATPDTAAQIADTPAVEPTALDAINAALSHEPAKPVDPVEAAPVAAKKPADAAPTEGEAKKPEEPEPVVDPAILAAKNAHLSEGDKAIVETLKPRSQERFRELAARSAEADTLKAQLADWQGVVTETGATPEEFGQSLQYMKLVHSDNEHDLRAALQIVEAERAMIAQRLGVAVEGVDVLASAPDLNARVTAGTLDQSDALEILRLRQRATRVEAPKPAEAEPAMSARTAAIQAGTVALNNVAAHMRAADPTGFDAKANALKPLLQVIAQTVSPDRWVDAFVSAYAAAPNPAPAAPRIAATTPQPLRSSTGGGQGMAKTPNSALEAITAALGR